MQKFKQHWQISKNWQLLYPAVGILVLLYSAYKLSVLIFKDSMVFNAIGTLVLFYALLKLTLFLFKKLEKRWIVNEKWQIMRIFMIFALTGTTSMYITNPIFDAIGLHKEAFSESGLQLTFYYIIKFLAILPIYKILLLAFGWLFGEYKFFYAFFMKMFDRFRFKKSVKK